MALKCQTKLGLITPLRIFIDLSWSRQSHFKEASKNHWAFPNGNRQTKSCVLSIENCFIFMSENFKHKPDLACGPAQATIWQLTTHLRIAVTNFHQHIVMTTQPDHTMLRPPKMIRQLILSKEDKKYNKIQRIIKLTEKLKA